MSGELLDPGAFGDIDTDDLCFSPESQPWMSDVFGILNEGQLSSDDLLTDAVSEFMKCKSEFSDILFQNNDALCLDDMEFELTDEKLKIKPDNDDALVPTDFANSGNSSGYTSGVLSCGTPSPSSSSSKTESPIRQPSKTVRNMRIMDVPFVPKKFKLDMHSSVQNKGETKRQVYTSAFSTLPQNGNNRVRFIVRPNQVVNIQNGTKSSLDPTVYSNVKRIQTVAKPKLSTDSVNPKTLADCSPTGYKNSNVVHFVKSASSTLRQSASPSNSGSQSSSDSGMREGFDDDGVAAFSDVYPDSSEFCPYDFNEKYQPNRLSLSNDPSKTYNFMHPENQSSRSLGSNSVIFDDRLEHDYIHNSRLSTPNIFRGQMQSRMRSPLRGERSEGSQSGPLLLSEEEKRTLLAEGYPIPNRLPLSKQEERNLKKVRRKIKNKISAQESRRKRKEYVETLERKFNVGLQENLELKRRLDSMESNNRSLLGQLRLMQQLLNKQKNGSSNNNNNGSSHGSSDNTKCGNRSNQSGGGGSASTCLMVFAICFAALLVGQPPDLNNRTSLDSGLTFGSSQNGFLNNLISQGPRGLSQIGYGWSMSNAYSKSESPAHKTAGRGKPHDPNRGIPWGDRFTTRATVHENIPRPVSHQNTSPSNTPRSRLLGSPSELEDCVAAPKSLWAYLFGSASAPTATDVCHCQTDPGTHSLPVDIDLIEANLWYSSSDANWNSTDRKPAQMQHHMSELSVIHSSRVNVTSLLVATA